MNNNLPDKHKGCIDVRAKSSTQRIDSSQRKAHSLWQKARQTWFCIVVALLIPGLSLGIVGSSVPLLQHESLRMNIEGLIIVAFGLTMLGSAAMFRRKIAGFYLYLLSLTGSAVANDLRARKFEWLYLGRRTPILETLAVSAVEILVLTLPALSIIGFLKNPDEGSKQPASQD